MKHMTFREAYAALQQNAQILRDQTEPNIDDLLNIVTESVAAFKVCQARIDAVEKALEKALSTANRDEAVPGSSVPRAREDSIEDPSHLE